MRVMSSQAIALVMAAGHSQRFGADKRRAKLADGRTLLAASVALAEQSFAETWVVLREEEAPAELGITDTLNVIHAPAEDIGLGISLATAFSRFIALEHPAPAVAVMLGDMPWLAPATCRRLAAHADPHLILRPRHGGRGGHPVLFGRDFWPRLSRLRGDQGAREVLIENPNACRFIDVDDPGIHQDIDLPQDI